MKSIQTKTWSTPLIIGSSMVVASSGLMMFFHLGERLVKSMHEWLGLLFVFAITLHLLNHWMPFSRYLKNKQALSVIAIVFVLATGWIVTGGEQKEHPAKRLLGAIQQAPISLVAELQHQSVDDLVKQLQSAGIQVNDEQQSINDLAAVNQRNPFELIDIAMPAARRK